MKCLESQSLLATPGVERRISFCLKKCEATLGCPCCAELSGRRGGRVRLRETTALLGAISFFKGERVVAQLVERPAEKAGAILTRVRVPGAARDFSPRGSFQCRLSYGVRTAPPCAIACINFRASVKQIPNTDSYAIVWTHESTAHTDRNG